MMHLQRWNIVLVVLLCTVAQVSAQCEDTISRENPRDILDNDMKVINTVKSCKELMKHHPDLCEKVGMPGGDCCKTCGDHTCLDKVGSYAPFVVSGTAYTTCKTLIKTHKFLCKTISQNFRECCRTCKGVDTSCVDELVEIGDMDCKAYVKEDRCRCIEEPAKSKCCETCKKKKTRDCACRDFLSKEFPAKVDIKDIHDKQIVLKDVDNCKEIIRYYAEFCTPLGREGAACCKSCKGVDPSCYDNLSWRITIRRKNRHCVDCTCHDLMMKSKKLMSIACEQNLVGSDHTMGAKEACCLQCKRLNK